MFAETDTGSDSHIGFLDEQFREFKTAQGAIGFGDLNPCKHRGFRGRKVPTRFAKTIDQRIPPFFIGIAHFMNAVFGTVQGGSRRNLNGRIGPVIEIGFHTRQSRQQALIADRKTHPPTRHREGFGHGREFHRHIHRPLHLQNRGRWLGVIEIDFGIGQI